jgi:hypothetical protein
MSEEGFEQRQKTGEQRIAERNVAELDQTLDGPGSEERLEHLRHKFRSARSGSNQPSMATLVIIGVAVFLTILIFGLGKPVIEMLAPK